MNYGVFRKFFLASVVVFAGNFSISKACSWSEDWEGAFYRFFEPDYESVGLYKPFHFTFDRLYDYDLLEPSVSEDANLESWAKYLGGTVSKDQIRQVVYESDVALLEQLRTSPGAAHFTPEQSANPIFTDFKAGKRGDMLKYLILAKVAEPFCNYEYDPWDETEREMGNVGAVIEEARSGTKATKDDFLRLRYAYQAMRLQQYSGAFESAIETYRQLILPVAAADPLIASWAQCHYAGCLRNQEIEDEAAYQFSRVFDKCPSRRVQAWYGWRILSDDVWASVQAKCKTNHEIAVVHFLRAFSPNAVGTSDLRKIHTLDPGSELLDVLLLREVNKLENEILGYPYSAEAPVYKRLSKNAAGDLLDFVGIVLKSGKMHDRNIWELAQIYLQFLSGDTDAAQSALAAKQPSLTGDGALKGKLLDLVFRIGSARSVDRNLENAIYKDFTNLGTKLSDVEREELGRFRDDAFAWLYESQGDDGKALLARDRAYAITNYPIDLEMVNDMIAFDAKEDKTLYEKELLARLTGENGSAKDMLLEIKGTGLLGRNLLPEAIAVFKQIQPANISTITSDPFRTVTRDVVNCEDCGEDSYNKLEFAEKLLALQRQAVSEPSKAAATYMALGNAYYNTSYFGAAWDAKDYYRSGGSWYSMGQNNEWVHFDIDTFEECVDMTLAKSYYMKALEAARSQDKEMAALAAFMIAKCELNQSYLDGAQNMDAYHVGFEMLKKEFRKTKVVKGLIKECWYLAAYTGK